MTIFVNDPELGKILVSEDTDDPEVKKAKEEQTGEKLKVVEENSPSDEEEQHY